MKRHPLGYLVDPTEGVVYGLRGEPVGSHDSSGHLQIDGRSRGLGLLGAHRIVWESVHGPIPDGLVINHLNGRPDDNRLANLEVVTPRENLLHAYRIGLKSNAGEKHPSHKVTEAQVREIRRLCPPLRPGQIANQFGLSRRQVSAIVRGESWTHIPMEVAG